MIGPLLNGLKITFKHMVTPVVTVRYPYEYREVAERYRGRHILKVDEEGRELCCACGLCEAVCPSRCITIYGEEDEGFERSNVGKIAGFYQIDYTRCIFCGFCVEACPRGAIEMTQFYELVEPAQKGDDPRAGLMYDKERLMTEPPLPGKEGGAK